MKQTRALLLLASSSLLVALVGGGCGPGKKSPNSNDPRVRGCDQVVYQGCAIEVSCGPSDIVLDVRNPEGDGCESDDFRVFCDDGCVNNAVPLGALAGTGKACAADDECETVPGGFCDAGTCTAVCTSAEDCCTQSEIDAEECDALCQVAGSVSFCTTSCSSDQQCLGETVCQNLTGTDVCWPEGDPTGGTDTGLGDPCEVSTDCETGLTCLSSDSDSLIVGGPPHGLCTLECEADSECSSFDMNSLCVPFVEGIYCMPSCTLSNQDPNKCNGRQDMVCDQAPRTNGEDCTADGDCSLGYRCLGSQCVELPTACLPRCAIDNDCPAGRFCDAEWGECVTEQNPGKPYGDACDLEATEDECAGFCLEEASGEGVCYATCRQGTYPACGSSSTTAGEGACLLRFTGYEDPGDAGLCVGLCDCSSDCGTGTVCMELEDTSGLFTIAGRPGVCLAPPLDAAAVELTSCEGGEGGQGP